MALILILVCKKNIKLKREVDRVSKENIFLNKKYKSIIDGDLYYKYKINEANIYYNLTIEKADRYKANIVSKAGSIFSETVK